MVRKGSSVRVRWRALPSSLVGLASCLLEREWSQVDRRDALVERTGDVDAEVALVPRHTVLEERARVRRLWTGDHETGAFTAVRGRRVRPGRHVRVAFGHEVDLGDHEPGAA